MFKLAVSLVLAVSAAVAFPQTGAGKAAPQTASPVETSASVMARVVEMMKSHTTAKGTLTLYGSNGTIYSFACMKPNLVVITAPGMEIHNSGTGTMVYSPTEKQYFKSPDSEIRSGGGITMMLPGLTGMLVDDDLAKLPMKFTGNSKRGFFRGQEAIIVAMSMGSNLGSLYFNAKTLDPMAILTSDGITMAAYSDLVFDAPMKVEDFAWTPPADVKLVQEGHGG